MRANQVLIPLVDHSDHSIANQQFIQEKVKFKSDDCHYVVEAVLIILICYILRFRPNALSLITSMQCILLPLLSGR